MPRRNQRADIFVPLDLTAVDVPSVPRPKYGDDRRANDRLAEDYRHRVKQERAERQALARVNDGIDWSVCVVPGCGEGLMTWGGRLEHGRTDRRDSTMELPICYKHAAVVWQQLVAHHSKDAKFGEAVADVNEAMAAREDREERAERAAFMAREDGEIYFVRLGGLVKVGWTRRLWQRVKSYGASAELLVSYPGTRDDETNLHRQLRPALAKGREWYEDGPIINAFIAEALTKYGEPPKFEYLWTQPKRIVAGKRHR